ncbi:MAG: pyruvate kinase [Ilumatobacter sp.]|uniref:pyruvate kinase n=1 Tax=Ilumatobacter sp. TaxID=1967498 RepID=UPI0026392889|nr:pyruvate kinase [Ilumatobacter sp.]MDJ0769919.1 pyruvate kinase [Ilumatobacter sp.]
MTRRTKIVATIGPASDQPEMLERLIRSGVDVVRLNLSHGPVEEHLERLARVRAAASSVGRPVGVLADLPGPKVRAGQFPEGGVDLLAGSTVEFRSGDGSCDASVIWVEYETLIDDLDVGDVVVVGDGAISMRVTDVDDGRAEAVVETGGHTQGRPGVHLQSERMRLTTPTEEDLVLAAQLAEAGVEFVAVSFVRTAADLHEVRAVVGNRAELVAKIETSAALDNLSELLVASDAIMVARGDLGIDCPLEDVPHLQKSIVRRCVEYGIPVIIATQMLESMITAPSPTRAEVTDVANAVFDGADALMLSGETAIGHDPTLTITTMARIAERAEAEASYRQWAARLGRIQREHWESVDDQVTAALTHAASQAADDLGAAAILCCTNAGRTARAMARFRPSAALLALSPTTRTVNALALSWGVDSIEVSTYSSTDEMVWYAVEKAVQQERISRGDTVLVLAGSPGRDVDTAADVMRIVEVR